MKKIGLLSDTHGFINERLFDFFDKTDEIWHAGDIGNIKVAEKLSSFKLFKAVYGNIDGQDIRFAYPKDLRFICENMDVWITHIGGYPGKYASEVKPEIFENPPDLFISGHSHILKIMYDKKLNLLHINSGASGNKGLHQLCTALRFIIDGDNIRDLEIWEVPRR